MLTKTPAQPEHSPYGPSGAPRWTRCTPSVKAGAHIVKPDSAYAIEGRLAHEVAEQHTLRVAGKISKGGATKRVKRLTDDADMIAHGKAWAEYVEEIAAIHTDPWIMAEQRVSYEVYVPQGYGTADCIIVSEGRLDIIDYKYGMGDRIEAERNEQLMCYALGAYCLVSDMYDVEDVHMHIFMPRRDHISADGIAVSDLLHWADTVLIPAGKAAEAGDGDFVVGNHCKYCSLEGSCRARAEHNLALTAGLKPTAELTLGEISEVMLQFQQIGGWIKAVDAYALREALEGRVIPGFKLVTATTKRAFRDAQGLLAALQADASIGQDLYEETKLLAIGKLEKTFGKDLVSEWTIKPEGKPTLVIESDKRPAYQARDCAEDCAADFAEVPEVPEVPEVDT